MYSGVLNKPPGDMLLRLPPPSIGAVCVVSRISFSLFGSEGFLLAASVSLIIVYTDC